MFIQDLNKLIDDTFSIEEILPIENDLKIFFWVVFGYLTGLCPFRSFPEKDNPVSKAAGNIWVPADDNIPAKALEFASRANRKQGAFYVIPGTVAKPHQASSTDILEMQVLLIDIDEGDTEDKLQKMSSIIGNPTLIVESGGTTESGMLKLHIYWQLTKPARGDDLRVLLDLRHKIALAFGGDIH